LQTIARRIQPGGPDHDSGGNPRPRGEGGEGGEGGDMVLTLVGLHEQIVGDVKGALLVLLARSRCPAHRCANVANLLLARAAARQAGDGRSVPHAEPDGCGFCRHFAHGSVLLSLAGGGLRLLLAFWGVQAAGQMETAPASRRCTGLASMPGRLAFTLGVS